MRERLAVQQWLPSRRATSSLYETARPGMPGGSPADRMGQSRELGEDVNGVRRGPLSTYDFIR